MIIDAVQRLEVGYSQDNIAAEEKTEYLVPLAYPFPDVGRIVGLIFIPFAAWFYGTVIDPENYPELLGVGVLGAFGKPVITIPLLLNIAELPGDIFNLFLASGVVAARFGDLMKTMHLIAFTILVSHFMNRNVSLNLRRMFVATVASVALLSLAVVLIRGYLDVSFKQSFSKEKLVTERELVSFGQQLNVEIVPVVLDDSRPNPDPIREGQTRIDRIKQRGLIRIGFDADRMPFSYYAADKKLIGFDIQMAYYLARDLGVDIEFVPLDRGSLAAQLKNDHFDVAMSALEGTVEQAATLPAIDPYMTVTLAVVVPDHRKREFRDLDSIRNIPDLKIADIKGSYFAERAPVFCQVRAMWKSSNWNPPASISTANTTMWIAS